MRLLVSALEPSANIHLEPIIKELPDAQISGIFDERFGKPLYPSSDFSVMGFFDVLPKIFKAREALKEMLFLAREADTVLLIDSPSFNLPLAKAIKKRYPRKKIVYYILPKIWAWKKGRKATIERNCDVLASIFPFEKQFYDRATYVGNPLLDEITVFKDPFKKYDRIAFLPGSRKSEIRQLMPLFREVAQSLEEEAALIVPAFFKGRELEPLYGDLSRFTIRYDMHETLARSDFAFVCSGTATLETALIGTPLILTYKTRPIEYAIAKRLVKLKYIGLANLILHFAGEPPLHPELLQEEATAENLLKTYHLYDTEAFVRRASKLKRLLGHGSTQNVIKLISL